MTSAEIRTTLLSFEDAFQVSLLFTCILFYELGEVDYPPRIVLLRLCTGKYLEIPRGFCGVVARFEPVKLSFVLHTQHVHA